MLEDRTRKEVLVRSYWWLQLRIWCGKIIWAGLDVWNGDRWVHRLRGGWCSKKVQVIGMD